MGQRQDSDRTNSGGRPGWLRTALVIAVTAIVVAPVTAFASDTFTDVPTENVFHGDINWLAEAGVTLGCNPPENDRFCPDESVTREQMAAFLRRLAENRVVDADTLDGEQGLSYQRPIAMATGSTYDGTAMSLQSGEVARITVDAPDGLEGPDGGTVKVEHTSSWAAGNDFTVFTWVEPLQSGEECDSFTDGDPITGTIGTAGDANSTGDQIGTSAGAGFEDVYAAVVNTYSLCLLTSSGTSSNIGWSVQAAWYPSDAFN